MKGNNQPQTRNKMLALIHLQKKQAGLTDEIYQGILMDNVGVNSASKINSLQDLIKIIDCLNFVLRKQGKLPLGSYSKPKNKKGNKASFLTAVKARAERILGTYSDARLQGFLRKLGKHSIDDCDPKELRRIMGFLSTIERKEHLQ